MTANQRLLALSLGFVVASVALRKVHEERQFSSNRKVNLWPRSYEGMSPTEQRRREMRRY